MVVVLFQQDKEMSFIWIHTLEIYPQTKLHLHLLTKSMTNNYNVPNSEKLYYL